MKYLGTPFEFPKQLESQLHGVDWENWQASGH